MVVIRSGRRVSKGKNPASLFRTSLTPSGPECVRLFPEMKKHPRTDVPFDSVNVATTRDFSTRKSELNSETDEYPATPARLVQSNCHQTPSRLHWTARFYWRKPREGLSDCVCDVPTTHSPKRWLSGAPVSAAARSSP